MPNADSGVITTTTTRIIGRKELPSFLSTMVERNGDVDEDGFMTMTACWRRDLPPRRLLEVVGTIVAFGFFFLFRAAVEFHTDYVHHIYTWHGRRVGVVTT